MTINFWGNEGPGNVKIANRQQLLDFFETFAEREPFYCEFVENESKLSVCVRRDFGSVQHSPANDLPPYMVAVTPAPHDPHDEVEFFVEGESTPLSARYALPLESAKQAIEYFLGTGERDPSFAWEEI